MKNAIYYLTLLLIQLYLNNPLHAAEKVNQSVDLGGSRQATWYLPDNTPHGWILLQHGFQRNKSNLDDLATHLMNNGLMVLTINSNVSGGNRSLARSVADDLIDNPLIPPNGFVLPENLVIAGHSAGGLFVSYLGGRLVERGFANLKGALLFDPVDKDNGMQNNLQSVIDNGSKVLSILANSSSCNSSNNALAPLRNLNESFVGIKLTDNSKHTDVEGSSSGGIITWLCGSPVAQNISYLQDYALNWINDMLTGNVSADYYPGGAKLQQLLSDNDGILIKEISQPLPPVANFTFSASELTVAFTSTSNDSDGSIIRYDWQFGDGQSSTLQNPSHSYNAAGTYNVTLNIVDNDNQSASIIKVVSVIENSAQQPIANFSFNQNSLEVSFVDGSTDSDGSITIRNWSFGDGVSSTQTNPVHTYAATGSYSVTLEVTDNDGLTNSKTQIISVTNSDDDFLQNGASVSGLSASQNEAVYFKMNVPTGAEDLKFAISGGTGDADIYVRYGAEPTTSQYDFRPYKSGNNETVEVASPQSGVWYLMIRAYQSFSAVTLTASYINPGENQSPNANFTTSANGLTVSFIDNSVDVDGSVVSWLWRFGDGSESSQQNPTYVYAEEGEYNVSLTAFDNDNANGTSSKLLVVSSTTLPELYNGQTLTNLTANKEQALYFVLRNVPAQTAELNFLMQSGSGDADIYIRFGETPSTTEYDYRPYLNGNNETVNIASPQAGDWYVMVRAFQTFNGVDLTATHTAN